VLQQACSVQAGLHRQALAQAGLLAEPACSEASRGALQRARYRGPRARTGLPRAAIVASRWAPSRTRPLLAIMTGPPPAAGCAVLGAPAPGVHLGGDARVRRRLSGGAAIEGAVEVQPALRQLRRDDHPGGLGLRRRRR
jgi:hypothetical protein